MSGNGEDTVVDLNQKFGVAELMKRAAARREADATAAAPPPKQAEEATTEPEDLPAMDKLTPLPKPGDPYKAHCRPSSQSLPTLHLLTADGQTWDFPYSGRVEGPHRLIIEGDPGKGTVLVLRFAASVAVEVIIGGTNLDEMHVYLAEHRIRWIRELPARKLLKDDGSAVVRTIIVRPVSPRMAKGWPISPQGAGNA